MEAGAGLLAGRYRLGEVIGRGGMADVHRATDTVLGRDVAVKLLRVREADEEARERFAAEARTLAGLSHPGLVTLLDAGLDDDRPFLVMELVDGLTLAQRMSGEALAGEWLAGVGAQVAEALAFAHGRGIVHRDVKPGNVLVEHDGRATLTDFGIARLLDSTTQHTRTGHVIGSPAYLAPEQVAGDEVGPPADVYALGLVLLEGLTGRRSFAGTPLESAYARLTRGPDVPAWLGPEWGALLGRMTAREPADRPSAADVASALRAWPSVGAAVALSGGVDPVATQVLTSDTAAVSTGSRTAVLTDDVAPAPRRRLPGWVWAAVAAVVAAVVLIALLLWAVASAGGGDDGGGGDTSTPPASATSSASVSRTPTSTAATTPPPTISQPVPPPAPPGHEHGPGPGHGHGKKPKEHGKKGKH